MKSKSIIHAVLLSLSLVPFQTFSADVKPIADDVAERLAHKPQVTESSSGFRSRSAKKEVSREYTARGARVVTFDDESKIESNLVEIPLMFERNSTELKGEQSLTNLSILAKSLKEFGDGEARFEIEGHASAEGEAQHNDELSKKRAEAIVAALRRLEVPDSVILKPKGYGSRFAAHAASADEPSREADRRVLIVREK